MLPVLTRAKKVIGLDVDEERVLVVAREVVQGHQYVDFACVLPVSQWELAQADFRWGDVASLGHFSNYERLSRLAGEARRTFAGKKSAGDDIVDLPIGRPKLHVEVQVCAIG